jgi:hypothetical protein
MRHIDRRNDIAGQRAPEGVENRYSLSGTGAQPSERLENFAGPRNLKEAGGSAALA